MEPTTRAVCSTCVTEEQCQQYRQSSDKKLEALKDTVNDLSTNIAINNSALLDMKKLGYFILTSILAGFIGVITVLCVN